jgi:hypothetical protein
MSFPITSAGFHFGAHYQSGGWGNQFGGCCNQMLGSQRGFWGGALAGGLIGTILGAGNPMMGLVGAGVGSLIGSTMGQHCQPHYGHHHHPHHQHCGSYPPPCGHHFGGPQYGGYQQPGHFGHCHHGQPHWGGHGCNNINLNFNFGHQCPQSRCCHPRPQCGPQGQLCQEGKGKPISYTTRGGYQVKVNGHTIEVKDPSGKNVLKHWGDPHENLNGKHLKDWKGKQRTVVLGDGTKITMGADGPKGVTNNTSIYDGNQNVQITNKGNQITHHSFNPYDTQYREMSQYDGETALFRTNQNGAGIYNNIYNEDKNFNISNIYQQLGRTGGYHNPGKVYDFYPGI